MARVKSIKRLTLYDMMRDLEIYQGLPDGLKDMPVVKVKIGLWRFALPETMEELSNQITYGQRLFLTKKEEEDFGLIIRLMDGYFYPIVTGKSWDENAALAFGKKILRCKAVEVYPAAVHLITLLDELVSRELRLLHREPNKMERAAGIDKLNPFSEMTSIDFLRDTMKIPAEEVMTTPYNECLVRFMLARETADYQDRLVELQKHQK